MTMIMTIPAKKINNGIFAFSNAMPFFIVDILLQTYRRHTVANIYIHQVLLNLQLASEVHYSLPAFDALCTPRHAIFYR